MRTGNACRACGTPSPYPFYHLRAAPANGAALYTTREAATRCQRAEIALDYCQSCGFIQNSAYDTATATREEGTKEYSSDARIGVLEARKLAKRLIDTYSIRAKTIVEIGCGDGEFLRLLCELGRNVGIGFDPAYSAKRPGATCGEALYTAFIKDLFTEKYAGVKADFAISRMTLDRAADPWRLLHNIGLMLDAKGGGLYIEVADSSRMMTDAAFWDVCYWRCSYFTPASISRLLESAGFETRATWTALNGQRLLIDARMRVGRKTGRININAKGSAVQEAGLAMSFAKRCSEKIAQWKERLASMRGAGKKTVVWGAGPRGSAFLTAINAGSEVTYAIDTNPTRHGSFIAGTGHRVMPPGFLKGYRPDAIIILNPKLKKEAMNEITTIGISPAVLCLE